MPFVAASVRFQSARSGDAVFSAKSVVSWTNTNGRPTLATIGACADTSMASTGRPRQAASAPAESAGGSIENASGADSVAPATCPFPFRATDTRTSPASSSKTSSSPTALPKTTPRRARTQAVPTFGWPAKGYSSVGVKIRTRAVFRESSGGSTKVISA